MELKRLTGPEAGSLKYDLLTAMSVAGLHGSPTLQTSMMRLIALVTARYNWRYDELTVGQRDMARMWAVDERTVKREIKRLTEANVLICKRKGVRGRVGAYRLNLSEVARISQNNWPSVGPDFVERMGQYLPHESAKIVNVDFSAGVATPDHVEGPSCTPGTWPAVRERLRSADSATFANWYGQLEMTSQKSGQIELRAPNRFVAQYINTHLANSLFEALEAEFGEISDVRISAST